MPDANRFDLRTSQRISGPAMRTFLDIADQWQLSEDERLMVLGLPGRHIYFDWIYTVRTDQDLTLPDNVLCRLSTIVSIYKALWTLFGADHEVLEWLRGQHDAPAFGGRAPMALIVSENPDEAVLVCRYLDDFLSGAFDVGDQDVTSYADDDIVIA
jgi:hypothetical protein